MHSMSIDKPPHRSVLCNLHQGNENARNNNNKKRPVFNGPLNKKRCFWTALLLMAHIRMKNGWVSVRFGWVDDRLLQFENVFFFVRPFRKLIVRFVFVCVDNGTVSIGRIKGHGIRLKFDTHKIVGK